MFSSQVNKQLYLSYLAYINCGSFPVKDCVILLTYVFLIQVYACIQRTHTYFPVHHSAHLPPQKLFSFYHTQNLKGSKYPGKSAIFTLNHTYHVGLVRVLLIIVT